MSIQVNVVFYSMYGHVYRMAEAIVEGAKRVPGAEVSLYQVEEIVPDAIWEKSGAKAAKHLSRRFRLRKCITYVIAPRNDHRWGALQ